MPDPRLLLLLRGRGPAPLCGQRARGRFRLHLLDLFVDGEQGLLELVGSHPFQGEILAKQLHDLLRQAVVLLEEDECLRPKLVDVGFVLNAHIKIIDRAP